MRNSHTLTLLVQRINAPFLDKFIQVAKLVRRQEETPFAGWQVIFCGDFYQPPPVAEFGAVTEFTFTADCWQDLRGCYEVRARKSEHCNI